MKPIYYAAIDTIKGLDEFCRLRNKSIRIDIHRHLCGFNANDYYVGGENGIRH
jgi:hypothetical protein